jgi:signal transduction histidine kinase
MYRLALPVTSLRYGGTGLGLVLSRRLCRLMAGDVTVTRKPRRGSMFSVRLPADVNEGESPAREGAGTGAG